MGVNFESHGLFFLVGRWGGFGPLGGGGHGVVEMKNFKPAVGISGNV